MLCILAIYRVGRSVVNIPELPINLAASGRHNNPSANVFRPAVLFAIERLAREPEGAGSNRCFVSVPPCSA